MSVVLYASVILEKDGKFLLVQEGKEIHAKKWNIPGGHVDDGEHFLAAAIREAKEEVCVGVAIDGIVQIFESLKSVHVVFYGKITNGTATPGDDILDCQWRTIGEMRDMPEESILQPWKFKILIQRLEDRKFFPLDVLVEKE